jgi:hypothetical protein
MVRERSNDWRDRSSKWLKRLASGLSGGRQHEIANLYLQIRERNPRFPEKQYEAALPGSFGAKRAVVRLSVPKMPKGRIYTFSEHASTDDGEPIDLVVACTVGGFAVSDDLGLSWEDIRLRSFARFPIVRSRILPNREILLLAMDPDDHKPWADQFNRFIVADMRGTILHTAKIPGPIWHGPRSVDVSGDTLMYSEYPGDDARSGRDATAPRTSRVWRSRDFARSWQVVFEQENIRHFHFLQARPGSAGEWWLTSGDEPSESRIWKSSDDGDTWVDRTDTFGPTVRIGAFGFPRSLFRLTDLVWAGDEMIWGSDDVLGSAKEYTSSSVWKRAAGSRVFRADLSAGATPIVLGRCGPEVRNIVDIGKFYVLITQSSPRFADNKPQVFLLAKRTGEREAGVAHLFDVDRFTRGPTGFTYSLASRRASNGVFFTFRKPKDVFRAQNRILKWQFEFE